MAPTDQLLKPAADKSRPIPGAYLALGLLLAMNLFNYIDRQVLAAVEPEIRKSFFPGQDPEGPVARSESGCWLRRSWFPTCSPPRSSGPWPSALPRLETDRRGRDRLEPGHRGRRLGRWAS